MYLCFVAFSTLNGKEPPAKNKKKKCVIDQLFHCISQFESKKKQDSQLNKLRKITILNTAHK